MELVLLLEALQDIDWTHSAPRGADNCYNATAISRSIADKLPRQCLRGAVTSCLQTPLCRIEAERGSPMLGVATISYSCWSPLLSLPISAQRCAINEPYRVTVVKLTRLLWLRMRGDEGGQYRNLLQATIKGGTGRWRLG